MAPVASWPDRAWDERDEERREWREWSEESWRSRSVSMGCRGGFRAMKGGEFALLGGSVGESEFGGVGSPPCLEGKERESRWPASRDFAMSREEERANAAAREEMVTGPAVSAME
jgi:hypothetical protein